MLLIRDLSKYDTAPIDYSLYDGLIIRCYDGTDPDPRFNLHKTGAIIAGKPWWPYAFYDFRYPAIPQVQEILPILQIEPGRLPIAFDVEEWGINHYPGRDALLNGLFALYDTYGTATNNICQFYMNPATIHYLRPIPGWLLSCPLWLAHWGTAMPDYEPWVRWTFWQYEGEPDLNKFNGTDAEYWEYINGNEVPEPPPPLHAKVNVANLTIRSAPLVQDSTILGYTTYGKIWTVEDIVKDAAGRDWMKVGAAAYIAGWYTVLR